VDCLDRIVHAVERLRYARSAEAPALRAELETVLLSLAGGAPRGARRRARWWPASVLRRKRRSTTRAGSGGLITARHGGVVDHVG
jgi:hypothetical protein